ncbi:hypothetical protein BTHI11S_05301 [Bosea thiooxidans]
MLIPLAALFLKAASAGPADIWAVATSPRTLAALNWPFTAALFAALVYAVFGADPGLGPRALRLSLDGG